MDLDWTNIFKNLTIEIEKTGKAYAETKAKSWYAQEMKSVILARLMNDYEELSVSKAEIKAKSSVDYQKHLEETRNAQELELKTRVAYEKAKAKFDAYRSLCSLEKKTRSLINGSEE